MTDTLVTGYVPLGFIRTYHEYVSTSNGESGARLVYEVYDGEKFVRYDSPEGVEVFNKVMLRLDKLWDSK